MLWARLRRVGWTELKLPAEVPAASAVSAKASADGGPAAEGLYVRPGGTAIAIDGEGGRQGVDFFITKGTSAGTAAPLCSCSTNRLVVRRPRTTRHSRPATCDLRPPTHY